MKKSVMLVLFLAVVGAVLFSLSGCSLSTSEATITVENYYNEDYTVEVETAGTKYLGNLGSVSFDVEWDGLGEESFGVDVWDGGVGGVLVATDTVSLSDGDSVTLWW